MSRQLNISRHDNTVTLDGASGPGFVCSVPDEFIDAVPSGTWTVGSAEDGTTEPAPVEGEG